MRNICRSMDGLPVESGTRMWHILFISRHFSEQEIIFAFLHTLNLVRLGGKPDFDAHHHPILAIP